ncbi:hypothetical protein BHECKSOX_538 [Bathymodiolus heckerae thiotrophic gill symbiont]|nr:hypothetical protein [uncultured Gammaproteobacteria bacterium]SHN90353.1 hypothetical protein BHECKSOX_538 [Bathymodiolus heckerae thiotrophic gill symbiont]
MLYNYSVGKKLIKITPIIDQEATIKGEKWINDLMIKTVKEYIEKNKP